MKDFAFRDFANGDRRTHFPRFRVFARCFVTLFLKKYIFQASLTRKKEHFSAKKAPAASLTRKKIHFFNKKRLRQASHAKSAFAHPKKAPAASLTRKKYIFSQKKAPAASLTRKKTLFSQISH